VVRSNDRDKDTDLTCEVRALVKKETMLESPVVAGDVVEFTRISSSQGVIERVLPRRSMFCRPHKTGLSTRQVIAANIDQLVIVASVGEPTLKTRLIDRFTVSARLGALTPVVVVNKIDRLADEGAQVEELRDGYEKIGVLFFCVSAQTGEGVAELLQALEGKKSLFVGHSGVGKSSLLNRLCPLLELATQSVSAATGRGRHTTTHVALYPLGAQIDGYVADSPGLKTMGLWEVSAGDLADYFPEFEPYLGKCRFTGCAHVSEPGCAAKTAVENGAIPRFRYESYCHIRETL